MGSTPYPHKDDIKEWMFSALEALARRPKAMQMVGVETAIMLQAEARESFRLCSFGSRYGQPSSMHRTNTRDYYDFSVVIKCLLSNLSSGWLKCCFDFNNGARIRNDIIEWDSRHHS